MDNEIRISTWNVQTSGNAGSTQDLKKILQDYSMDITVLQDIRKWKGPVLIEDKTGQKLEPV